MSNFNCDPCKRSFPTYGALVMHYQTRDHVKNGDHAPARADCETAELPEGYELRIPNKDRKVTQTRPTVPVPEPLNPENLGEDEPAAAEGGEQDGHTERRREPARTTLRREESRHEGHRDEREEPGKRERRLPYKEIAEPSAILKRILDDYPGMPDSIIDEIMSWADSSGTLAPMQVQYLLTQMAEVPKGAAALIPQKYSLALQTAAQSGQAEVLSALDGWSNGGYGQGGFNPMTGGMPRGFGGRNPMNPMFGMNQFEPFGGGGSAFDRFDMRGGRRYSRDNFDDEPDYRPRRRPTRADDGDETPRSDPRYDRLESALARVTGQLEELTTKKKEDALNQRLDRIEDAIASLLRTPPGRDDNAGGSVVDKLAEQMAGLKEEIGNTKNSRLEEKLANLQTQFEDAKNERITALQDQITDLKDAIKHPTGRTDMDVVDNVTSKALDTIKNAGQDIRSYLLSGRNEKDFDPNRVPAEKRIKTGQALAATVEKEARILSAEDALLSLEK